MNRIFVDSETDDPVPRDAQTKGFEIENGQYIMIDPEEVAATIPESNKTLEVDAFIPCAEVDDVYFDKPYYLTPDRIGADALHCAPGRHEKGEGLPLSPARSSFRRIRTVLVQPHGKGLIATTLNFDYEVRSSAEAFGEMPKIKIKGEMLDLAKHIIGTKKGKFNPAEFEDRYELAARRAGEGEDRRQGSSEEEAGQGLRTEGPAQGSPRERRDAGWRHRQAEARRRERQCRIGPRESQPSIAQVRDAGAAPRRKAS